MRQQPEKSGIWNWFCKKRVLETEVAQNGGGGAGVLGAYLFIIFTFTCQHDQPVGVCSSRLKKGGGVLGAGTTRKKGDRRSGPNSKKGDLGAGQVKGGSRECPPPPAGGSRLVGNRLHADLNVFDF